ncbi:Major facilitator superfamily MFS_1 [Frankia canadensis]|uniref:Major facilitator superfamily MFS_1 n=1 Tax=Frankia canadensis TaxID=1836972 RepID=A0A2I2L180_9ACTN|nr:MFS transporter [Frankia canadensis]SNQ51674.1 Major facilitator superfamily MFS_1 [Frankia canadensis]SOU58964.1 Major facilitator superfamily MFS_1 [Frankia canadensis]
MRATATLPETEAEPTPMHEPEPEAEPEPAPGAEPRPDQVLAWRLRPLQVGVALQNMLLWVPVEKMFMTQIGFDAAAIGLVAAVYAAVAPVLEVPFGILADRWNRTGMVILATLALAASSLVGGLSTTPATYVGAAVLLGVFFALNSGTVESIVYDTVVEETGSGDGYERWIGRMHVVEAAALVASAVLGGVLAAVASARVTYFATVPLMAAAALAFGRCHEPRLHRHAQRVTFRRQALATVRVLAADRALRPVVLLSALTAVVIQVVFGFGPLWLVSLHAPAALYGPYWAALVSTGGLGGWLVSRTRLDRPAVTVGFGALLVLAAILPTLGHCLAVVIAGQFVVALAAGMISIRAGRLLHDAVGAQLRAGVTSGAGTLSWLVFLPVSVLFGQLSRRHGVQTAGLLPVLLALAMAALLAHTSRRPHPVADTGPQAAESTITAA